MKYPYQRRRFFFMSRAVFLAILATHFRDRMDLPKQKVPLGIRLRSRRRGRSRVRGPHGTGRTDLTATCAAEHQPIWAAHSSPTRRHVSRQGWNGRTKGVERRTKGVERRTRTGGTADQRGGTADQNGWNGGRGDSGPERVERRTSTQRGNFDVFGGVALRQDNELIFARKRDFWGGHF